MVTVWQVNNDIMHIRVLCHIAFKPAEEFGWFRYGVVVRTDPKFITVREMDNQPNHGVVKLEVSKAVAYVACRHCNCYVPPELEICDRCKGNHRLRIIGLKVVPKKTDGRSKPNRKPKVCDSEDCQTIFVPSGNRQIHCGSCLAKKKLKKTRKYKYKKRICPECQSTHTPSSGNPKCLACPKCGSDTIPHAKQVPAKVIPEDPQDDILDVLDDDSPRECSNCNLEFEPIEDETLCVECLAEVEAYRDDPNC